MTRQEINRNWYQRNKGRIREKKAQVMRVCRAANPERYALARHLAMYFCRRRTALSLGEIATAFGRLDHGTVSHGCHRIERGRDKPEIAEALRLIEGRLEGYFTSLGGSVFASFTDKSGGRAAGKRAATPGGAMNL